MKKTFFLITFFTFSFSAYSQKTSLSVILDTNYYYRDTIDKKVFIGRYKPTGLIEAPQNALIISNELSTDFPELYDNSKPPIDHKMYLKYQAHWHISSGCIFRLNNQFKKDWEIILKDKRVEQIKAYDDTSFIAAGDNIDMRKIWVARMRLADGKTLWLKEFPVRHQSTAEQLGVSFNKDIILLTNNKRIIPISIRKQYYKTRILFFKKAIDLEYSLSLSSLSSNGKLNWTKTVDFKNGYDFESTKMTVDTNINIISWYEGFDKVQGKYIKREGENGYVYNTKGRRLIKKSLYDKIQNNLGIYKNGWVFVNIKSDSISVEKLDSNLSIISHNIIKVPKQYEYLEALYRLNGAYYLCGLADRKNVSHLICKFDDQFHLLNYWIYNGVYWNDITQLTFDSKDLLTILGNCSNHLNLVKLDLK
jgi:hypothetical protein